jgi:hypothetical protein
VRKNGVLAKWPPVNKSIQNGRPPAYEPLDGSGGDASCVAERVRGAGAGWRGGQAWRRLCFRAPAHCRDQRGAGALGTRLDQKS